ncbi:uncharacterized protein FIBRA_06201 [Fibroporia radiculosa]|uniref:Uncharacterized protein n=1 Tax=Fibroporia radiculosa TaxID=599839 RepID=J4GAT5_9APHY|nr:uncharacterized protein FIBRA_06201 [Fibroporia radiculosa]CCM04043.1 predicted protein [Fibroporia radiculosa]
MTGSTLAKTNDDIFDQLARLSQLRTQSPALQVPQRAPSVPISSPLSYQSGLGMGSSPVPIGQHMQHQQTGLLPPPQPPQPVNGPRGPLAPVPANQSLLQPLIPTTTGFNNFVPTRPQSVQSSFQSQAPQPSFLSTQPTGFPGSNQSLLPQATGFPGPVPSPIMAQPTGFNGGNFSAGPMVSQPTGMPANNYGGQMGQMNGGFTPTPSFQNGGGFGIQSNPTGYASGFGQSPFGNGASSPPAPPSQPAMNTSPANIFAQMKSGTFASDNTSVPQSADKYDALRPAPSPLTAQPTGWGYQGMNVNGGAFTGGYGYQH